MNTLPNSVGVGFKPDHFAALRADAGPVGFLEVHAENYMGAGGLPHAQLTALRSDFALSLHGVGLSIGGPGRLDADHLARLKALCQRYEPESFSEHLAWSSHGTDYLNDLLPLPYTPETLALVCDHVDAVQSALGRRMLLENPSTYVLFEQSTIPEVDFLREVATRTGCGLLLDVNNLVVNALNEGADEAAAAAAACRWVDTITPGIVGEIHLAGYHVASDVVIDDHGSRVHAPVWQVYRHALRRLGWRPTLVEWDTDLPDLPVLLAEAAAADAVWAEVAGAAALAPGALHAA